MAQKENMATLSPEIKSPTPKSPNPKMGGVKFAIFVAFVLSLAALAGTGYLYQELNAERRQRQALEAAQVQFQDKVNAVEQTSEQYRTELERMRSQLASYTTERQKLNDEVEKGKSQISDLKKKLTDAESKAAPTSFEDENAIGVGPQPTTELNDLKVEVPRASVKTEAAPVAKPEVKKESLKPSSEPSPAPAKTAKSEPPSVKPAQVLTVNRKFNFVVVNIGIRENVKMGDELIIERNGKAVGLAKVEKLYENFSAATILKEPKDAPFQGGESVRRAP